MNKKTTYIFTTTSFTDLLYDLQMNVGLTQIFTEDIPTILP